MQIKLTIPFLIWLCSFEVSVSALCSECNLDLPVLQTGEASFYSDKYEGKKTASGEPYRSQQFTAAHQNLKYGTKILVQGIQNSKCVVVRINDRGRFKKPRILDLSRSAAMHLNFISEGKTSIEVYLLKDMTSPEGPVHSQGSKCKP